MRSPWWCWWAALALTIVPSCTVSFDFPVFVGVTRWPEVDAPSSPRATLDFVSRGRVASTETFMSYWGGDIGVRAESLGMGDLDDDGDLDAIVSSPGVISTQALVLRNERVGSMTTSFVDATAGVWASSTCMAAPRSFVLAPPLVIVAPSIGFPTCAYRQSSPLAITALSAVEMPVPAPAEVVVVGDVSGDGLLDVFFGAAGASGHWLISMRDHWEEQAIAPVDLSDAAAALLADLDADAQPDFVMLPSAHGAGGHVLHGQGMGRFVSTADTVALETRGVGAQRLAIADLDADARPDLALFDFVSSPSTVSFFWNRSDDTGLSFESTSIPLGATLGVVDGIAVTPGDFDLDGFTDLVLTSGSTFVVLQNHGDGTFSERVFTLTELNDVHSTSVADVDLDGDLDLVACWGPTAAPITRVCSILENQTNGTDFLELALRGPASNAHAVGASVVVYPAGAIGDATARPLLQRTVVAASTSRDTTMVHVGLPPSGVFDVRVTWPDGTTTDILGVERATHLRVEHR